MDFPKAMRWIIRSGDICDVPTDVLVCSGNVFLNLSGGVGGALLLRYGPQMQRWLHQWLASQGRRKVEQGEVVVAPPCGTPYRAVIHAVAIDGMYQSSAAVIEKVTDLALQAAARESAQTVAMTALATGFGRVRIRA